MSEIRVDTISEKTSANGVAIDSVTLKDGAVTATAASTITVTDNSDTLSLISTDADANAGPILRLFRNSASPADDDVAGSIVFSGEDDAGNETDYASIKVITEDVTNTTEDGRLSFNIIDGGSAKEVMSIFDDFVGIGTTAPEQLLHIHANDSGSSYTADSADRLIIENNDSLRIDMRTGTSNTVGIMFSDTTRNQGSINFSHSTNQMTFSSNAGSTNGLHVYEGAIGSNEAAPDISTGGLCLNQGADDDSILTLKSSDVAHPFTNISQTDTYLRIRKFDGNGGVEMDAYRAGNAALEFNAYCSSESDTKTTQATAAMRFNCALTNGSTGATSISSNDNLCTWHNDGAAKMILDAEGDLFTDGTKDATYDAYEDAQLVRAYDLSHGQGVINSTFDKYVKYNHESLAEAGLVGREADGTPNHFINVTGFQRLHNGAIWQQYEKHQRLAEAVYEMAKEALGEDKADAILEKHDIKLLN